jgi:polysaccharide chain length determinant protein (PEP-CTERM system associated)
MNTSGDEHRQRKAGTGPALEQISLAHYLRLILYRKWTVIGVTLLVSAITFVVSYRMPNIYTSDTLILVDPQKVPETYVKSTVTGDIRNRLGTLSQQILSSTRLQKIIETLNLYPEVRKIAAREDIIGRMRSDISVQVVSDFGASQDLQAFRISYSGREPRLVAQVTNELASLFIEENLKAREQQATGTTEFLQNQLQETRKALETQEAKLGAYKRQHIGEMPEQQSANLQILGQLQSQLQLEGDALSRAEQQKSYIQSMLANPPAGVVELDDTDPKKPATPSADKNTNAPAMTTPRSTLASDKAKLAALLSHYTDKHPEVRRLKKQIEADEAKEAKEAKDKEAKESQNTGEIKEPVAKANPAPADTSSPSSTASKRPAVLPFLPVTNPVLQSQLKAIDAEIAKHKEERQRLVGLVAKCQAKLEAIPVREQEIAELVRDYEMSKAHYSQLLDKQLSAETATQLEIRQKGEKFTILDPGQVPERPTRPNRKVINAGGSLAGFVLGLLCALLTEFLGVCITGPEQITAATGFPVLEVIPVIRTQIDRLLWRRRLIWGTASGVAVALIGGTVLLYYYYRSQFFY